MFVTFLNLTDGFSEQNIIFKYIYCYFVNVLRGNEIQIRNNESKLNMM